MGIDRGCIGRNRDNDGVVRADGALAKRHVQLQAETRAAMTNKAFRWSRALHAWGGATLALLVLLNTATGTLLVWKNEYVRLTVPEARVEFEPTAAALARIASAVEAQFDNDEILLIQFGTQQFPLTKITLTDARYAYCDIRGNIVDEWVQNERFEEWLYDLHHRLLLENTGLTIVGLMGLALIILVVAGVISFWPLRRAFPRGLWPKSIARPHLLNAHRNVGIIEALPFLLMLVTGVVLAFPEQAEKLLLESVRSSEEYGAGFAEKVDAISGGNSGDWLPAMRRALATFPGAKIRSAQVPNTFSPYRIIGLQQSGGLHPQGLSKVYIDAEGGYMDVRIDDTKLPLVERLYSASYPLHTGKVDSMSYKLFLTVSGLLVSALSVLGLVCFIGKVKRQRGAAPDGI
ncbi:MAG TPA: PepSY-associated TM helix domain-containing protein [Hyphomicrobiaceae bacterium]